MNCSDISYSKILLSDRKALKQVEPMLNEIKQKFNLNDELYYNLIITVTEAINNAIIHGNKLDNRKHVTVCVKCHNSSLSVSVKDEGSGFDLGSLGDPLLPENLLKENGRGIFIMNKIADKVEFNFTDEGTEITLYFSLG